MIKYSFFKERGKLLGAYFALFEIKNVRLIVGLKHPDANFKLLFRIHLKHNSMNSFDDTCKTYVYDNRKVDSKVKSLI